VVHDESVSMGEGMAPMPAPNPLRPLTREAMACSGKRSRVVRRTERDQHGSRNDEADEMPARGALRGVRAGMPVMSGRASITAARRAFGDGPAAADQMASTSARQ